MEITNDFFEVEPNTKNPAFRLIAVPFDGTSTYGKGADLGVSKILEASKQVELYDLETDTEVYKKGINLEKIIQCEEVTQMVTQVHQTTQKTILKGGLIGLLGGEHSISIGAIQAFKEKYDDLTVLQLDAHTDLRSSYLGSPNNHACAMHWASQNTHLVQVGIRSMDIAEKKYVQRNNLFLAQDIVDSPDLAFDRILPRLTDKVYLTIDLDVFDPSVFPATGTPEPGGVGWYPLLRFLRQLFSHKKVVGFDLVELCPPMEQGNQSAFTAAKLLYKIMTYSGLN